MEIKARYYSQAVTAAATATVAAATAAAAAVTAAAVAAAAAATAAILLCHDNVRVFQLSFYVCCCYIAPLVA